MQGTVSALDGLAVAIEQPSISEVDNPQIYYNQKGLFAICMQAAVGADYRYHFVSAKHPGSNHDTTAFNSTSLASFLFETMSETGLLTGYQWPLMKLTEMEGA